MFVWYCFKSHTKFIYQGETRYIWLSFVASGAADIWLAYLTDTIIFLPVFGYFPSNASVAELVDAADSKSASFTRVWVRFPPLVPSNYPLS